MGCVEDYAVSIEIQLYCAIRVSLVTQKEKNDSMNHR